MIKKTFALDYGAPKRLMVTHTNKLTNVEVLLDGTKIASFATKEEFQRGTTCKLPDGSLLTVRYGKVEGVPLLKGIHLVRNGLPLGGSAADAVPKWSWIFMGACLLIPIISLGGAIPFIIAAFGVGGILSISRFRWSTALRAGICALITLACWGSFALVAVGVSVVKAGVEQGITPGTVKLPFASSTPDEMIRKIGITYYNHGYKQQAIEEIKDNLYDNCDQMDHAKCMQFLEKALVDAQNAPDIY